MPLAKEVVISLSKGKLVLYLLGALLFAALGAWMLTLDVTEIQNSRRYNSPFIVYGAGGFLFAMMAFLSVVLFWKLFDNSPAITLNAEGIVDNSNSLAVGLIPWSEIEGFSRYQVQRQWFISIFVKDPVKYVEKGNALLRMTKKSRLKNSGTPIAIPTATLKMNQEELFDTLLVWFEKKQINTQLSAF